MAIINGNVKKIELGLSSFKRIREDNALFIDKSLFIEHFLEEQSSVQLIVRQRRLGKSLNLNMLATFLSDKEDSAHLFKDLAIEKSSFFNQINSYPVFYFDFKNLTVNNYKQKIAKQIFDHIASYVNIEDLSLPLKMDIDKLLEEPEIETEGLLLLTKVIYEVTKKRSIILIDEYDKLLTDNYNTPFYDEIKEYETHLLSAGLKGNNYLQKSILTGVMRISRESILSGLNNLVTYDLFDDDIYTTDFGLTEIEIDALNEDFDFNKQTIKDWYNGIKINGTPIYNIYSTLSYLNKGKFNNYWGQSGRIEMITNLMTSDRENIIAELLNGNTKDVAIESRISLNELANPKNCTDKAFYALLVQAGYLSIEAYDSSFLQKATIAIPNLELSHVWKEFILNNIIREDPFKLQDLFSLALTDVDTFSFKLSESLSDKLSYYDLAVKDPLFTGKKQKEQIYHVFVLGLLSAFDAIKYNKPLQSNREAGDGRFDILFESNTFSMIFEFKTVEDENDLDSSLDLALKQIDEKRYYIAAPNNKPLIKVAIAFCQKRCVVKSLLHKTNKLS